MCLGLTIECGDVIMATYSTNKKLRKIVKKPIGRYVGASLVGRDAKRIKIVMCWREAEMNILLIGIS